MNEKDTISPTIPYVYICFSFSLIAYPSCGYTYKPYISSIRHTYRKHILYQCLNLRNLCLSTNFSREGLFSLP